MWWKARVGGGWGAGRQLRTPQVLMLKNQQELAADRMWGWVESRMTLGIWLETEWLVVSLISMGNEEKRSRAGDDRRQFWHLGIMTSRFGQHSACFSPTRIRENFFWGSVHVGVGVMWRPTSTVSTWMWCLFGPQSSQRCWKGSGTGLAVTAGTRALEMPSWDLPLSGRGRGYSRFLLFTLRLSGIYIFLYS